MANKEHLSLLEQGVEAWNLWRKDHPGIRPDLSGANLINQDFSRYNFDDADLSASDLSKTQLSHASLNGANLESATLILADLLGAALNRANLSGASFFGAFLFGTRLKSAVLKGSNLLGASLMGADLTGADLSGAHLMGVNFHEANLRKALFLKSNLTAASLAGSQVEGAVFDDSVVQGISAWNLVGNPKSERGLILASNEKSITVDSLQLAQTLNPILFTPRGSSLIRKIVIDAGLVIGRFRADRAEVYETIRQQIRSKQLIPILGQLEPPGERKVFDRLNSLLKVVRFIIVDFTGLKPFSNQLSKLGLTQISSPILFLQSSVQKTPFEPFADGEVTGYESLESLKKELTSWLTQIHCS